MRNSQIALAIIGSMANTSHVEMDRQLDMEALHRRARNSHSKYRPMNETGECRAAARRRRQMGIDDSCDYVVAD